MGTVKDVKKKTSKPKQPALTANNSLPCIWVDNVNIGKREDNICLLRFFSTLPEGSFEQTRFFTDTEKLKVFIDAICHSIDYYPVKPQK